jgi:hypothetical protein
LPPETKRPLSATGALHALQRVAGNSYWVPVITVSGTVLASIVTGSFAARLKHRWDTATAGRGLKAWPGRVEVSPIRDTGRLAEGPPGADADAGTFAPLLGWSLERKL